MLLRLRMVLAGVWLSCIVALGAQAAPSVVIISSEGSAAYVETAQALTEELERSGVPRSAVLMMSTREWMDGRTQSARLYVTLGAEAAGLLAGSAPGVPVLCARTDSSGTAGRQAGWCVVGSRIVRRQERISGAGAGRCAVTA